MVFFAVSTARGYSVPRAAATPAVHDSLTALGDVPDSVTATIPASQPAAPVAVAPSASAVASAEDLQLLTREIAMPIAGIESGHAPQQLQRPA